MITQMNTMLSSEVWQDYAVLSLYANHKQKTYHVHKLVAETFLVKVDGKNYIDHINGIKTDNRLLLMRH